MFREALVDTYIHQATARYRAEEGKAQLCVHDAFDSIKSCSFDVHLRTSPLIMGGGVVGRYHDCSGFPVNGAYDIGKSGSVTESSLFVARRWRYEDASVPLILDVVFTVLLLLRSENWYSTTSYDKIAMFTIVSLRE